MCVICIKTENIKIPTKDFLHCLWNKNSDGAGYMFCRNDKVQIRKGFMDFDSFFDSLEKEQITDKDFVVFHFRIATRGGTKKELCHPFPIESRREKMFETNLETNYALAHNGTIKINNPNDMSDSAYFANHFLSDKIILENLNNKSIIRFIKEVIGLSRIVIVNKNSFIKFGKWHELNGYFFSNIRFINTEIDFIMKDLEFHKDDSKIINKKNNYIQKEIEEEEEKEKEIIEKGNTKQIEEELENNFCPNCWETSSYLKCKGGWIYCSNCNAFSNTIKREILFLPKS